MKSQGRTQTMRRSTILTMMTVLALTGAATSAMAQKSGGILKIYHRETPSSTSIHEEGSASTIMPFMNVMNNLVLYDQSIATYSIDTIRPDLAESWSWNDDRTKLTFKLREGVRWRSEEHTSELQSLMRISYAVFCL